MPLGHIWNLQWLNLNGQRRYPLADDAGGMDITGSFKLPDDFLLELDLPVHAGFDVDPGRFFIKHIGAYATGYSIVVGYQPVDGNAVDVATALIARQLHKRNTMYALGGIAPFEDSIGKVMIGNLESIDQQPPGFFTFGLTATRLEPDAIRPIIRGVSALVVVNNEQKSVRLTGDVELVAGANFQLVPVIQSGQDPQIIFNAIEGEGTVQECVCEGDAAVTEPIKKFNGIQPTPTGDFTLVGSECIQIEPIANGLRIINTCAKPCCGCEELERITQDLERLKQEAVNVEGFADSLQTSVSTMDLVVLGARLGDRSCVTCE